MCATATPSSSRTPTGWVWPSCTRSGAAWAARAGKPTPTSPSGGIRPSPTSPRSGFPPSGSSRPSAPASASPCATYKFAARAVCWATASTATWRPWAMTSMSRCWVRPSPGPRASPSSGTRANASWTCGWTPSSRRSISPTARAVSRPTSASPPSRPPRTPPTCWTNSSTATATRRPPSATS